MDLLIFVLIINLIATIIFVILEKKNKNNHVFLFAVMFLLTPIFGLLIYILPHLMFKITHKRNIYDPRDLLTLQMNEKYVSRPLVDEELDIVPFEEAMAVGTTDEKRSLLLDVLKRDMLRSSKIAKSALNDKDSETSHYAAAATMEIYRKLKINVQEIETKFLADKTDQTLRREFLDALYEYIASDVLSRRDYLINATKFVQLFNETRNTNEEVLQCKDYLRQVDFLLELNNPYNAETVAKKAKQLFYNEDVYLKLMEVFFKVKNQTEFLKVFEELKKANISLSNHGLETIRFWIARGE
ncbi:MAG: hypothetical protein WCL54_05930 [Clostridia bacterium]